MHRFIDSKVDVWFNVNNADLLFTGTKCAMEKLEDDFVHGTFQIDFNPLQPAPRSRIPLADINTDIDHNKRVPLKRKSSSKSTRKTKTKKTNDAPTGEILSVSKHGGHRGATDSLGENAHLPTTSSNSSGNSSPLPTRSNSTDNNSLPPINEDSPLLAEHDSQLLNDWWYDGCVDNNTTLECLLNVQKELAEQQQLILQELRQIKQIFTSTTFNHGTPHQTTTTTSHPQASASIITAAPTTPHSHSTPHQTTTTTSHPQASASITTAAPTTPHSHSTITTPNIHLSTPTLPYDTNPHHHSMITTPNAQMSSPNLPHLSTPESSAPKQWIAPIPPSKHTEFPLEDIPDRLLPVENVAWLYKHLLIESKFSAVAVKLAREVFFGDAVLKECTPRGWGSIPALPHTKLNALKMTLFDLYPCFWSKPECFERKWTSAQEALAQVCKRLRQKNRC